MDLFPTLCSLCDVALPEGREGMDVSARHAAGSLERSSTGAPADVLRAFTKDAAFTEWEWAGRVISAIRTKDYRLVTYRGEVEGELYDHRSDPGELHNLWSEPEHAAVRHELLMRLLDFTLGYERQSDNESDRRKKHADRYTPSELVQFGGVYWSNLEEAFKARRAGNA